MKLFLFIGALLLSAPAAKAETCTAESRAGLKCRKAILGLQPSQSAVGMRNVEEISAELDALRDNPKKLKKYLKKKRITAVIDPQGNFHIIDGHHHAVAIQRMGLGPGYIDIEENFSDKGMSQTQFWKEMEERRWVRLADKNGYAIRPSELPKTVLGLSDDPYRSLAGVLADIKGFRKTALPFLEFYWADYLREKIPLQLLRDDWDQAVREAIKLGLKKDADDLPGYRELRRKKRKKFAKECWKQYRELAP